MEYDPTLVNNKERKEFCKGKLFKAGSKIPIPFDYSPENPRAFTATSSIMPLEYLSVTEVIKTSRRDIPFNKDDEIELQDGRRMIIDGATYNVDKKRVYVNGGIVGWILFLNGGKP